VLVSACVTFEHFKHFLTLKNPLEVGELLLLLLLQLYEYDDDDDE